jgi:Holliday junction resolvasome RuvABC endonuclease subunit
MKNERMPYPVVMAIDPGFASFGVVLVQLALVGVPTEDTVVLMDVIRTKKSTKKTSVLASDDNYRRAKEIATRLRSLINTWNVVAICGESMSFPRSSSAAAKVALSWGVVADIAVQHQLPLVQASPQRIKAFVCGRANASKDEVACALNKLYPEIGSLCATVTPSEWEHPMDALAAFVACKDGEVLRMARPRSLCQMKRLHAARSSE